MSTKIYNGIIFKSSTYKDVIRDLISAKELYKKEYLVFEYTAIEEYLNNKNLIY